MPRGKASSGMFEIFLHRRAKKMYERLPTKAARFINVAIDSLKQDPLTGPNIKRLHGKLAGLFRIRVGDYRIVYKIDEAKQSVLIFAIGQRGSVY